MAQIRFWNFKDDDTTFRLNQWLNGILNPGVYRGFDFVAQASNIFRMNHAATGFVDFDIDSVANNAKGVLRTPQGTYILEDGNIDINISANAGPGTRFDLIFCQHEYIDGLEGGAVATYAVSEGVPGGGTPALQNPEKQILIGVLTLPQGFSDLQDTGVVFIKEAAPTFSNDPTIVHTNKVARFTKQVQLNDKVIDSTMIIDTIVGVTNFNGKHLVLSEEANRYIFDATSRAAYGSYPEISFLVETPAGTEIVIDVKNEGAIESVGDIGQLIFVTRKQPNPPGFVPILTSGVDRHQFALKEGEGVKLVSRGASGYVVNEFYGKDKIFRSNKDFAQANQWTKIGYIEVRNQGDFRRAQFDLITGGTSDARIRRATVNVFFGHVADMSSNVDQNLMLATLSNTVNFQNDEFRLKIANDDSTVKRIDIYTKLINVSESVDIVPRYINSGNGDLDVFYLSQKGTSSSPPAGAPQGTIFNEADTGFLDLEVQVGFDIIQQPKIKRVGDKVTTTGAIARNAVTLSGTSIFTTDTSAFNPLIDKNVALAWLDVSVGEIHSTGFSVQKLNGLQHFPGGLDQGLGDADIIYLDFTYYV